MKDAHRRLALDAKAGGATQEGADDRDVCTGRKYIRSVSSWQRFVWLMVGIVIVTCVVGFIVIPADVQVPRQFDSDGWTSFSSRNVTLGGFMLAGLFVAVVFHFLLEGPREMFIRVISLLVMPLMVATTVAAVLHAG